MRKLIVYFIAAAGMLLPSAVAQNLVSQVHKVEVETCDAVSRFEDCHDNYPTGCSESQSPRYGAGGLS